MPETAITNIVEKIVTTRYRIHTDRIISHASKSPTAAGINISGMISIRNRPVSSISERGKKPNFKQGEHQYNSIDACRNWKRKYMVQQFSDERKDKNNPELFQKFHL